MRVIDRYRDRMMPAWSPVNHAVWLQKLWLVTVFLLLCGFGFFAIPLGGLNVTAGRIALVLFLYLCALGLLVHWGKADVHVRVGRYVLFFGIWLLWAVASLFWVSITVDSGRHIEAIIVGSAIVLLSLLFLSNERGIRNIHYLWVIAAAIFIAIAIWEVATGMHLSGSREGEWISVRETYPTAVFWNPNDFATFLCLALPFMFGMLILLRNVPAKIMVSILLLASFYFIVLTASRANIVASLVGVGLVLLMPGLTQRLKSIAIVLVVAGIVLLAGYTFFPSAMTSHFDIFGMVPEQISSINPEDSSTAVRMDLIRNGWAFLQESRYMGVGAGAFEQWMAERPLYYTGGIVDAHNWWLEMLVNYGVLLFSLFLVFYLGLLWNLFRIFRNSHDHVVRVVALASLIALVEFSVASASSSGLIRNYAVWLLLATALCIMNHHRILERKSKAEIRSASEELGGQEVEHHA